MVHRSARCLLLLVAVLLLPGLLASCGAPALTPTPAYTPTPQYTPTAAAGRAVFIPTEDPGVQLQGTVYGSAPVAVIFSHMGAQRQETWEPAATLMVSRGYMVVTYNMRFWVSETQMQDSLRSRAADDLRAVIAFARAQGARDVVLVGASLGGMATAKVAAVEKPLALAILAAPMEPTGLDFKVDAAEVRGITAPKLFIYSQDEQAYIREGAQQMYDLAPEPKELHVYPGTAHGTELFDTEHRDDLLNRLQTFIEANAPLT